MTLQQFLSTLQSNNVQVTIVEGSTELITFKSSGYEYLDDELEAKEIESWFIPAPLTIKIKLVSETTN